MILIKCCRNVTLASFKNLQWKSMPKMQKYHFTLSFCIDLKYSKILKTKLFSMLLNLFKGLSRLDMTERQQTQTYLLKEMLLSTLVRFWFPILFKTCPLNKFFKATKPCNMIFQNQKCGETAGLAKLPGLVVSLSLRWITRRKVGLLWIFR